MDAGPGAPDACGGGGVLLKGAGAAGEGALVTGGTTGDEAAAPSCSARALVGVTVEASMEPPVGTSGRAPFDTKHSHILAACPEAVMQVKVAQPSDDACNLA